MNNIQSFSMEDVPNLFSYNDANPIIISPQSPYQITFAQTRESLLDVDLYKHFLYNAMSRFRSSAFYRHYKAHLMSLGIDMCQYHSNIKTCSEENDSMATIEMHHFVLTLYEIAFIITEHILNTYGRITTFDLVELLRLEHEQHRVCTVFLCKTCHQRYHHDPDFYIPLSMGFGKWYEFLERYNRGINPNIYYKIYYLIKKELQQPNINVDLMRTKKLLELNDNIFKWSEYYEQYYANSKR